MASVFAQKKLRTVSSLGAILRKARKKKEITLEKVELDTKVRLKYLLAMENDDFSCMPADVYNIGFLGRYCDYLGLNKEKMLKRYKQDREVFAQLNKKNKKSDINPGNASNYQENLKFVITPQIFITCIVIFAVLSILGYIWFQVKSFAAAPYLDLNNPNEQIMISSESIEVAGKTDPSANIYINNQLVGVGSDGKFSQNVKLEDGINEIEIKAENKINKTTTKVIKVLSTDTKEGEK